MRSFQQISILLLIVIASAGVFSCKSQKKLAAEQAATEAARKIAKAKADLEEANLELSYTQVRSPVSGRVGRNLVDVGNLKADLIDVTRQHHPGPPFRVHRSHRVPARPLPGSMHPRAASTPEPDRACEDGQGQESEIHDVGPLLD